MNDTEATQPDPEGGVEEVEAVEISDGSLRWWPTKGPLIPPFIAIT